MKYEIWRDIPNYEGLYQVSDLGRIKSLPKKRSGKFDNSELILKSINKDGYIVVNLWKNKKKKTLRVHRLVAKSFIPNPKNLKIINHIDGNRSNNSVNNLEWCTYSRNTQHAYDIGLNKHTKNIIQYDLQNKFIKKWGKIKEASLKLQINDAHIIDCCKGRRKTAGGYKWQYIE